MPLESIVDVRPWPGTCPLSL